MVKISKRLIVLIILIIIAICIVRFGFNGGEDNWIKDSKGVYVKHGNPSSVPDKVKEQREAIDCANKRYSFYSDKIEFNSQCLGTCGNYVVDVVNIPRTAEDNKAENQCTDFREGKVNKFIELDKNGKIVRIVD